MSVTTGYVYDICMPKKFNYGTAASKFLVMFSYDERTNPRDKSRRILVNVLFSTIE